MTFKNSLKTIFNRKETSLTNSEGSIVSSSLVTLRESRLAFALRLLFFT